MIYVIPPEPNDPGFQIWSSTEVSPCDGRCIGTGATEAEALQMARFELRSDMAELWKLILAGTQRIGGSPPEQCISGQDGTRQPIHPTESLKHSFAHWLSFSPQFRRMA